MLVDEPIIYAIEVMRDCVWQCSRLVFASGRADHRLFGWCAKPSGKLHFAARVHFFLVNLVC